MTHACFPSEIAEPRNPKASVVAPPRCLRCTFVKKDSLTLSQRLLALCHCALHCHCPATIIPTNSPLRVDRLERGQIHFKNQVAVSHGLASNLGNVQCVRDPFSRCIDVRHSWQKLLQLAKFQFYQFPDYDFGNPVGSSPLGENKAFSLSACFLLVCCGPSDWSDLAHLSLPL